MAKHNIKGKDLAEKLDISANAVSALRNSKTMPRLDGVALNSLCNALNVLAEDLDKKITPADLLDYTQDPEVSPESEVKFSLIKRGQKETNKRSNTDAPVLN